MNKSSSLTVSKTRKITNSIIYVAMNIFEVLKLKKILKFQKLFDLLKKRIPITTEKFIFGLNFLFAFDAIEYLKASDELRICG